MWGAKKREVVVTDAGAEQPPESTDAPTGDEAEYFVDDVGNDADVVVLMCILNQGGTVLQGRRIWRRLAVPADFNLLELHVVLQNAFDWEDTHLHDFTQPVGVALLGGMSLPLFQGHGPTDLAAFTQHMLDIEGLAPEDIRTFKAVVGVKEDPTEDLILTKAEDLGAALGKGEGEGEGEGAGKRPRVPGDHCLVYVEHSHPHSEAEVPAGAEASKAAEVPKEGEASSKAEVSAEEKAEEEAEGKAEGTAEGTADESKKGKFAAAPTQVLEERAFLLGHVVTSELPVLVYEYDFRMGYEVHLFFEGRSKVAEGVNYPTCLAGQGASPAEDGDDMDDQGNLLPSYDYEDFAVLDVLANFEKTFDEKWPVGPGAKDKRAGPRCYLCRYNRECGRRRECTGRCCDYCHKGPLATEAGRLLLSTAQEMFDAAAERIRDARQKWAQGHKCDWVEDDGQPCVMCSE